MATEETFAQRLRRSWLPILVGLVAGALLGGVVSLVRPPSYTASATGLVVVASDKSVSDASAGQGLAISKSQTYAAVGQSLAVAGVARRDLASNQDASSLLSQVSVTSGAEVPTVTISATAGSPSEAANLAEAWFAALKEQATSLEANAGSGKLASLVEISAATEPRTEDQPSRLVTVGILSLLGALCGMGVAAMTAGGATRRRSRPRAPGSDVDAKRARVASGEQ